jgi:hypothetical protein
MTMIPAVPGATRTGGTLTVTSDGDTPLPLVKAGDELLFVGVAMVRPGYFISVSLPEQATPQQTFLGVIDPNGGLKGKLIVDSDGTIDQMLMGVGFYQAKPGGGTEPCNQIFGQGACAYTPEVATPPAAPAVPSLNNLVNLVMAARKSGAELVLPTDFETNLTYTQIVGGHLLPGISVPSILALSPAAAMSLAADMGATINSKLPFNIPASAVSGPPEPIFVPWFELPAGAVGNDAPVECCAGFIAQQIMGWNLDGPSLLVSLISQFGPVAG